MSSGPLIACCICGQTSPGGTCLCAHTIAVTISGLVKHPDLINCCSPGNAQCPLGTCNTIIRPPAPNGTYLLRSCPPPADGCAFMADLQQPYSPPGTAAPCDCGDLGPPWSDLGSQLSNCLVAPPVNIRSWISLSLAQSGSAMAVNAATAVTVGRRNCNFCGQPFGPCPGTVFSGGDYQGSWLLPSGNSTPAVSLTQFCAGTPFTVNSFIANTAYGACGFNGPGTFTVAHQAGGPCSMTVQLVN